MTIATESTLQRPVSVVFTAGRAFYLVNNVVYFSQVLEGGSIAFLSKCYQKNDPTAEQLSDLLATDGGTIPINEANRGVRLSEIGGGIAVFCDNGVWSILGPEGGFTATNFQVRKITDNGCVSGQSVIKVGDAHYYWGQSQIHLIQRNEFGQYNETNITEDTIETFYKGIPLEAKKQAFGFYNRLESNVEWLYTNTDPSPSTQLNYAHDKGLVFNLRTQGFFPQDFNARTEEDRTAGDSTSSLVAGLDFSRVQQNAVYYFGFQHSYASFQVTRKPRWGQRDDTSFQDFGVDYPTAYLETGAETLGKPSNVKSAPYTTMHFLQTEQNWVSDGSGGFILDDQSACKLQSKWDWNNTSTNGRWGPQQQAYRFRRNNIPSGPGPFDSGEEFVTTKNKVLGRGKALSLRLEQEAGKNMKLVGYTTQWTIKVRM